MKELSLLMFVAACGYILNCFFNRFSPEKIRQHNFFIPSQREYNILWGFAFYMGFAALMLPTHHKFWPLVAIIIIFVLLFYYKLLYKTLQKAHKGFLLQDLQKRLLKQQKNDSLLNRPYSRAEALRLLGLTTGTDNDNPWLAKRIELLQNFADQNPNLPYLSELLTKLKQTLYSK